jgi:hypothetical protein
MSLKQYIPAIKYGNKLGFDELEVDGAANSDVLTYNSTTGAWEPAAGGGGGVIPLPQGEILVGDVGGEAAAVAMSGDIAIDELGVTTIQAASVEKSMLATGIDMSHIIVFAGQHTTVGGAAAEAITVTGALNTDLAFVQLVNDGTSNVSVLSAVVTANTLTVTFSANPGNDAVINYQLIRAAV